MSKLSLRKATKRDVAALVLLEGELADYHHNIDPGYAPGRVVRKTLREKIEEKLSNRNALILIVENETVPVGFFSAEIKERNEYFSVRKIGYLMHAYLQEQYRGQGTAKKTVQELTKWLKGRKVKQLELNVDSHNTGGVSAWENLGFEEYQKRMRRIIR